MVHGERSRTRDRMVALGRRTPAPVLNLKQQMGLSIEESLLQFEFDCYGPAALANAGGRMHLQMRWLTPTKLKVTYDSGAAVPFKWLSSRACRLSSRTCQQLASHKTVNRSCLSVTLYGSTDLSQRTARHAYDFGSSAALASRRPASLHGSRAATRERVQGRAMDVLRAHFHGALLLLKENEPVLATSDS